MLALEIILIRSFVVWNIPSELSPDCHTANCIGLTFTRVGSDNLILVLLSTFCHEAITLHIMSKEPAHRLI